MLGGTWEGGEMMLLAMFIGLPSIIVAHILAIVAICSVSPARDEPVRGHYCSFGAA